MELQIRQSFLQALLWYHSPFDSASENPVNYGYAEENDSQSYPVITNGSSILNDFPSACRCKKCAHKNMLPMEELRYCLLQILCL